MAVKINWTQNSQVVNGPKVAGTGTVEADAYDNVEVTVAGGATVAVEVQPAAAAGKVKFLLIKSDNYTALSYKIAEAATLGDVNLDAQLLLVGEGALKMVGGAPKTFTFTNGGTDDANVQILVARNAT
jgi:PDZ domain-containing secreted protein